MNARDCYGRSVSIDDDIGNLNPLECKVGLGKTRRGKGSEGATHVYKTNRLHGTVFHPASILPKDNSCSGLHGKGVSMRRGRCMRARRGGLTGKWSIQY